TWWVTEAIPIPATSLLPLVLFPMGGIMGNQDTASFYGDDIVFLFLGGFLLAVAMEKWNLHTRIALSIIKAIGTTTATILLGFMISTALLSMFVSNTAAVMIMIPIGLAIIKEAHALSTPQVQNDVKLFEKALVLSIGYAGTIGGLGTLIVTPPLIILSVQMNQIFDVELNFAQWMLIGVTVVIVMLGLAWAYMNFFQFKHGMKQLLGGCKIILEELEKLGKITRIEKWILAICIIAGEHRFLRGVF